ncbi:hypothetical protein [Cognatilysobacter bugurensis]|uniref:Uncharacterized protein n=1 Tax=Cognatilysobacter bugurensis TaxID=543356 RepID=A0A918T163_9GAMM|nr:hypothetical protein [Lysobacter bugurensis]GHA81835.1 hypothetical protein GCM10007067_19650 [Lysobacter bugurensis]
MKRIGWIALAAALAAHAAQGKELKAGDVLAAGEGALITSVTCGPPVLSLQIYEVGTPSGGLFGPFKFAGVLPCRPGLWTARLKAGRYYIGLLGGMNFTHTIAEDKAPQFTIEAGKLNYIGDVYAGNVTMAPGLDEPTRMRTLGRLLTVLNREPQARDALQAARPDLAQAHTFIADRDLPPPVAVGGTDTPAPGEVQGLLRLSPDRWVRDSTGAVRVCPRFVPLPQGVKRQSGEPLRCDGDFVAPEAFVAAEWGPSTRLRATEAPEGEDGPLVIAFTAPSATGDKKATVRRQLSVTAGHWAATPRGVRVCYDRQTHDAVARTHDGGCLQEDVTTRDYLDIKVGGGARFVGSTTGADHGHRLLIDYDIDVWKDAASSDDAPPSAP